MTIQHLPPSASGEDVAAILSEECVVVVDNLISEAEMDSVAEEIRPWTDATAYGPDDFSGRRTKRTGGLVARSQKCRDLVMNPTVLAACAKFLGHATSYQLHLTQVIAIGAGEPAQPIHRDQWAYDFFTFPKGYEVQCNTIWALDDFTEENGATRVIPGSTCFDDKLRFEQSDTVPAVMRRGSVVFYTGSVYH